MNNKTQNVWHFSNGHLAHDRDDKVVAGLSLAVDPATIRLCNYGLHGSLKIIDALQYADGSVLSYCELSGNIIKGVEKLVGSTRRHLIVVDVERTLHEFALWCAEQALALIDKPDERSLKALQVKLLWLDGKATDDDLTAARDAANEAAWEVAGDAAWAAANDAAWAAAWDAAWDAARAAAWDAANDAAGDAARAAAWEAARAAANDAAWDAAWAAAGNAAWAAAGDAQSTKLEEMILELPEFVGIKEQS